MKKRLSAREQSQSLAKEILPLPAQGVLETLIQHNLFLILMTNGFLGDDFYCSFLFLFHHPKSGVHTERCQL